MLGLSLIAIGSGGIKPCVSAHLGDQFNVLNKSFISKAYSWFYIAINLGAFTSTLLIPYILFKYSANLAFLIPGIFMLLATIFFWLGRYKFVHIKPEGTKVLSELDIVKTQTLAIAVNEEVIQKINWGKYKIKSGDTIEIVEPLKGG